MAEKTQIRLIAPKVEAVLTLNEAEIRALDALVGYGIDGFLKVFYEKMGRHYLQPHENGLRSLFKSIGVQVRPAIDANRQMEKLWRKVVTEEAEAGRAALAAEKPAALAVLP